MNKRPPNLPKSPGDRRLSSIRRTEIAARETNASPHESEDVWHLISDSLPGMIAYIDAHERYRVTNAAYEARSGFSKENLRGQRISDVIGAAAYARLKPYIAAALAGERVRFEGEVDYKTTGRRYVHVDYIPRRSDDGSVVGFYALTVDITERKRTEAELRASERWLQSLVETTQDAVISIDDDGRIILFNPSAERMFGYNKGEVEGQKINVVMPEPYASEHDGYLHRYQDDGKPNAVGRIRALTARRKTGETFPIELSVTEVAIGEGKHGRYAAFIRDVSERARLHAQLVENERLAAIGTTMSVFAHEVGNPLNAMFITAQLVQRDLAAMPAVDPSVVLRVKSLKDEMMHLSHLLHDFRALSRRQNYNFGQVVLTELMCELYALEAEKFKKQRVTVVRNLPADLPLVRGDREKLTQALLNLCENACQAMPDGGTLTCNAEALAREIALEIKDTGIGIPDNLNIFEPFVTTKPTGTGLGLMIVRQIISAHGGTISYKSKAGEGTVFRITLPIFEAKTNS